ncbi:MFS transporter [Variovorax sp. RA8]|uniref:MFS transporter n=1 Tax=Variovorax sp. (strain JCM 16519 / RA8) TaxID=662548 RepID=UPI0013197327|nr:MFS transporter [Variovorax sp. RA8]VTU16961.1 Major Facilitator Superfamily protein [Variovorax sp. RA8]
MTMPSADAKPGTVIGKRSLTALLWVINLSSISASVLVYIFLAHHALRELDSLLVSEFVLFAPMVVPVILALQLSSLAGRFEVRMLLRLTNALGAAACLVLFQFSTLNTWVILIGATVIGALDAIQRVARIVVIKQYFSTDEIKFTVPLTLTAQFIAGAVAGAIMAFFPSQMTAGATAIATISLFACAALCTFLLPPSAGKTPPGQAASFRLANGLQLVRELPALRRSLVSFVLLGSFFQGFYNISRVALPAYHLGLSQQYVGLLQIVASLAAVAGALYFYFMSRRGTAFDLRYIYPACATAMFAACIGRSWPESYPLYFAYFFLFELAFFRLQADIMAATPKHQMPMVAALQYALVYAGMMLAIFVGAFTVKWFGLAATAALFATGFGAAQFVRWRAASRASLYAASPERN